jgi:hypothetical protein
VGVESIEHQEDLVPQSSVSMVELPNSAAPSCDCLAHVYGNAADRPELQRRYPTDMTDAEWAAIRPLLPVPGWMHGRGGQPEAYCHRHASRLPAVGPGLCLLPSLARPRPDRSFTTDCARDHIRTVRGAGVIDSQSVKADAVVGADSRSFDGGKLINGRKRPVVSAPSAWCWP